jgi:rhomboid protease GluP
MTYALIAANLAMFAVEIAAGASPINPTPQQILDVGGSYPPLTLGGEWWRLGSAMFLHFGILHIALNMVCLYQARIVEQLFGRVGFVAIYLLAGLGGGVATLLVSKTNAVSAGASGAVFGVYGAFGAFLVLRRSQIDASAWQRTARSVGRFLLLNLIVGLGVARVSLSAHVGGLLVGFGVGAALLAGAHAARDRVLRAILLTGLGVALTAVAVLTLHAALDLAPVLRRFEAVERTSVTRWNEENQAAKHKTIGVAELVERLEREVIVPYRRARNEILATADVPDRLHSLIAGLDDLSAARLAAWEQFVAALREPDAEKKRALLEAYHAREREVRDRLAAYDAEVRKLMD